MKAVILAAGTGNRLEPYTSLIPKPLLPVGGKPCITYIIERLEKGGFTEIIICVNTKHLSMFQHELRDRDVTFSTSQKPLGTAGELLNCKELLDEDFLVHYGDELTAIDYNRLTTAHFKNNSFGTLAILEEFPLPVGYVETDKEVITAFKEKQNIKIRYWVGIAMLKKEVIDHIRMGDDLAKNVFPRILKKGMKLSAEFFDCEWIDIGNIARYKHAVRLAQEGLIS